MLCLLLIVLQCFAIPVTKDIPRFMIPLYLKINNQIAIYQAKMDREILPIQRYKGFPLKPKPTSSVIDPPTFQKSFEEADVPDNKVLKRQSSLDYLLKYTDGYIDELVKDKIINDLISHRLDAYIPAIIRPLIIGFLSDRISKAIDIYCINRSFIRKFQYLASMDDLILEGVATDMQRLHLNVEWTPQFLKPYLKVLLISNLKVGLGQFCRYVEFSNNHRERQ